LLCNGGGSFRALGWKPIGGRWSNLEEQRGLQCTSKEGDSNHQHPAKTRVARSAHAAFERHPGGAKTMQWYSPRSRSFIEDLVVPSGQTSFFWNESLRRRSDGGINHSPHPDFTSRSPFPPSAIIYQVRCVSNHCHNILTCAK
jgi:hypothetical protein